MTSPMVSSRSHKGELVAAVKGSGDVQARPKQRRANAMDIDAFTSKAPLVLPPMVFSNPRRRKNKTRKTKKSS